MFDLTDVGFVKRITVGSTNPERMATEEEVQAAADLLNRCLSDSPKGRIIGVEKNFSILNIGEHQVVLQCVVYHVGFPRKPYWLE
ncbi:hypothetical protein HHL28_04405 [Aerophototrophica crusticola]|uniref:Uncharacterized protein n=1 Tax=Aerophototrophica crusticola TaxID=1709002 RepID=A0A858R4P9_9PROT|nr:hypothetical protein HHL28_04405 [Rhodospirillaceae bacterium B3]